MKAMITTHEGISQIYNISIKNVDALKLKYGSRINIIEKNVFWRK